MALRLDTGRVEVIENGVSLYGPMPYGVDFRLACLYVEMSSHSNHPPREVFLDNIRITREPSQDSEDDAPGG